MYNPKNSKQEKLDIFLKQNFPIVVAEGPAGTGKTLLSTQHSIQLLHENKIKKIVMTRPTVFTGSDIGFLPGTLEDKMQPWMMPMLDVFQEFYTKDKLRKLLSEGIVEIVPLGFMRGRSFRNCAIVADEMQNSSTEQMKMLLTRVGENSKLVITGDLKQTDLIGQTNGLEDLLDRLQLKYISPHEMIKDGFGIVRLDGQCIERHPVIVKILDLYS
ncbi:MAG: PhoH family protein [Alphaproteobacteria bacterium]|nr:PhoH family protein [Alphaproteobacteria bacterium]